MHDSTCESSEEVGSEAAVEYDEDNPDYESDEYQLVKDFISILTQNHSAPTQLRRQNLIFQAR